MARCGVCEGSKEGHSLLNHEFSETGELIPKRPMAQKPERLRVDPNQAFLRLLAILREKQILTEPDLLEILSGRISSAPPSDDARAASSGDLAGS